MYVDTQLHDPDTSYPSLTFYFDGVTVPARPGQTIAAALMARGQRVLRYTRRDGQPRGLFCGMGVCFDCLVQVDGRPNVRACQTPVVDGMCVETQRADGSWEAAQ